MGMAKRTRISQRMSQQAIQLRLALRITASVKVIPSMSICLYHKKLFLSTVFYLPNLLT